MLKRILLTILVLTGVSFAQSVDPTKQIDWSVGPVPYTNPLQTQMVNGIPQVATWTGVDACAKLNNAIKYAISHNLPLVDASGLVGIQACNSNPFANLTGASTNNYPVNVTVQFGATHFQTSVQWVVTNSALVLRGLGPWSTQVEYICTGLNTPVTGCSASAISSVLYVNGGSGNGSYAGQGIDGSDISGMWFYGGAANATDGLLLKFVNRSKLDSIYAWGVTGCGIHTEGAVTDTFIRPRVSVADAFMLGIQSAGHTQPANGICLDGDAGAPGGAEDTTSGSIIDAGMEGVTGIGIYLESADQMVISGGTSEQNQSGIVVNASSSGVNPGTSNKFNMFQTIDLEGNTLGTSGVDITDNGQLNTYMNILAASTCSACQSINLTGGGSQYLINGYPVSGVTGGGFNGISPAGSGATSATAGSRTLPSQPAGFIEEYLGGNIVKIPYYNN